MRNNEVGCIDSAWLIGALTVLGWLGALIVLGWVLGWLGALAVLD